MEAVKGNYSVLSANTLHKHNAKQCQYQAKKGQVKAKVKIL